MSQILLSVGIAVGGSTAEAVEGFLLAARLPESHTQCVLGALVVAYRLQQRECLGIATLVQQFTAAVDGGGSLVGHVVEEDAHITGVTLVGQHLLVQHLPCVPTVQLADAPLALTQVALAVDDVHGLLQVLSLYGIALGQFLQVVAEVGPCLTATDGVEQ